MVAAARLASPSPLRHRQQPPAPASTKTTTASITPGGDDTNSAADGRELCAESEAMQEGDRLLLRFAMRESRELSEWARLKREDDERQATQQQQAALDRASKRRVRSIRRRRRCRKGCARFGSALWWLSVMLLRLVMLGAVTYGVWRAVEWPGGESSVEAVIEAGQKVVCDLARSVKHTLQSYSTL